jgi:hypothetical protein
MFIAWSEKRINDNARIRESNSDNKAERDIIIKKASKESDRISKLISEIMSTIDRNTQELIKNYRRPFNVDEKEAIEADGVSLSSGGTSGPMYSFDIAVKTHNWYHIFEAAKAVTVTRMSEGLDGITRRERQNEERKKLESMVWSSEVTPTSGLRGVTSLI